MARGKTIRWREIHVIISEGAYQKLARLAFFHNASVDEIVEESIIEARDLGKREKQDLKKRIAKARDELKTSKEM